MGSVLVKVHEQCSYNVVPDTCKACDPGSFAGQCKALAGHCINKIVDIIPRFFRETIIGIRNESPAGSVLLVWSVYELEGKKICWAAGNELSDDRCRMGRSIPCVIERTFISGKSEFRDKKLLKRVVGVRHKP